MPRMQVYLPEELYQLVKGGTVLTSDRQELEALAAHAEVVRIIRV